MWWLTTHRKAIDATLVRQAIARAELRTSAEVVVSVAPFFLGSVWRAAQRTFERLGVVRTRARTGVLIFVVPSRRELVVLADEGVHARLGAPLWNEVAAQVAAAFGRGAGTTGLVGGIDRLGGALGAVFPRSPDDVDELPDAPDT